MSGTRDSATESSSNRKVRLPVEALMTIGDVAREFGVTLRALRFYEDRGLIKPFRDGNARFYSSKEKAKISQILRGKSLGFTLGEISDLLTEGDRGDARAPLPLRPEQIQSQINHLKRQRQSIDHAIGELSAALMS